MAELMPCGFFVYSDTDNERILYANAVIMHMAGCNTEEEFRALTGNTCKGLVHPEDLASLNASIESQTNLNEQGDHQVEFRIICKDRSVRRLKTHGYPIETDVYGRVFCIYAEDITEINERAEEDKRKAEIIEGLSTEFNSIYLIDFERQRMFPYAVNNEVAKSMRYVFSEDVDYRNSIQDFAENYVYADDVDLYLKETDETRIRERIANERSYSVVFRRYDVGRKLEYVELFIARLEDKNRFNRVIMGYKSVTAMIHQTLEEVNRKTTNAMIRALASDLVCLIDINLENESEVIYNLSSEHDKLIPDWSDSAYARTRIRDFAERIVVPEEREAFMDKIRLDNLKKELEDKNHYAFDFHAVVIGKPRKLQSQFSRYTDDQGVPHLYVGIRDVE